MALEFPENLASEARLRLHDIAEYFNFSSHSTGKKPNRKTIIYPKNLFIQKQEVEKTRLEKEREKYRQRYDTKEKFPNGPPENPTNFKEIVMREIWFEKFAQERIEPTHQIMAGIGQTPNVHILLELIAKKKEELTKLQDIVEKKHQKLVEDIAKLDTEIPSKQEEAKKAPPKPTQKKPTEKDNLQSEDSAPESSKSSEPDLDQMDEATKAAYLEKIRRMVEQKEADAKLMAEYNEKLEKENLKTFKDAPDEVHMVYVVKSTCEFAELSWDPPEDNNSKIKTYHVYMSNVVIKNTQTPDMSVSEAKHEYKKVGDTGNDLSCWYKLNGLEPNSAYYVLVTAENEHGEGYRPAYPSIVLTQPQSFQDTSSMYVWGSNSMSELGLSEQQVEANKQHYNKTDKSAILSKPIKHDNFNQMVHQVAPGNISTTLLCVDKEYDETFIIQMGMCVVMKGDQQLNLIKHEQLDLVEDLCSMPFEINFRIPVVKIITGDAFAGVLTAEG